jgi:hypothetical protein
MHLALRVITVVAALGGFIIFGDLGELSGTIAWNAYLLGLAIVAFALWHLYAPEAWKEWTNLALGVWVVISPWVLGFSQNTVVTTNMVIVGLIVSAFAAYLAMHEPPQAMKQRH